MEADRMSPMRTAASLLALLGLALVTTATHAAESLPGVVSMIDKLAKRGIIHRNKAANIKRKLARRVNTLASA